MMQAWVSALCEQLGVPVDDVDVGGILELAKDAAHNVERPAAPVTAFVAGYAAALRGGGDAVVTTSLDTAGELARGWNSDSDAPDPDTPPLS